MNVKEHNVEGYQLQFGVKKHEEKGNNLERGDKSPQILTNIIVRVICK